MTGNSGEGKWAYISLDGLIRRVKAADVPKDARVLLWTQDEVTPESSTGLLEIIRREQEDKARTIIESGRMGDEIHGVLGEEIFGDGPHAKVLRASIGDSKAVRKGHRRQLLADADKRSPEAFNDKLGSPKKLTIHETPLNDWHDKYKQPNHLTAKQVINLYSAVSWANLKGVMFNAHVIIRWDLLGFTDHAQAADVLQNDFLRHLNQWHRDRARVEAKVKKHDIFEPAPLYWLYVHECHPPNYEFHTHLLINLAGGGMKEKFESWARLRLSAISLVAPVPSNAFYLVTRRKSSIDRQWIWFNYFCKGLDPLATVKVSETGKVELLSGFISHQYINPGPVNTFRRIGISQNLRPRQRGPSWFKSEMELGRFSKHTLYTSKLYDQWQAAYAESMKDLPALAVELHKFPPVFSKTSEIPQPKTSDRNPTNPFESTT